MFTHRLTDQFSARLSAADAKVLGSTDSLTPALVQALPDRVQDTVVLAYQQALTPVFRYLAPLFALGLVLAFLLPEKKLAGGDGHDHDSAAGDIEVETDEAPELTRK
ncbi:hypothetical protein [Streptomyces tailanensis]|uniref:hypothetical protein n=1 Tax=Streptomyces tailanensis TaxID=2569858 RepID=UPI001FE791B1|nr:hypothetical protein [Streptomyces tailanensis]